MSGPKQEPGAEQMTLQRQQLVLTEIKLEAEGVVSLTFHHPDGALLPKWQPGAHLEIALPSGKLRQYSLCGNPANRRAYKVAVLRVLDGNGGSSEVHNNLRVGRSYAISGPRNHFELLPAGSYLFIAGGIGVTPIMPMVNTMGESDDWRALYCGKTRSGMAFLRDIESREQVRVFSDDQEGRPDFAAEIASCSPGTRVYCCGPSGMLDAVSKACSRRDDITLCIERFAAASPDLTLENGQDVELHLARSGVTLTVAPDETVLQAVQRVKPEIPWSCGAGFCGTCETAIIEGDVEHLDQLHSAEERKANRTMMICVSRPRSARLILDL